MSLTKKTLLSLIIAGALFVGFLVGLSYFKNAQPAVGNVEIGGELTATTTATGGVVGITSRVSRIQYDLDDTNKAKSGMLGSIILSTSTVSSIEFYDATTTNVNLRTGNIASSSLLLHHVSTSTASGVIPLNVRYRYGLIMVWSGTMSSTTITSR